MKREHLWPMGLVAILLGTVAINVWVLHVAGADPSFAIEPNYYARAVAWDSTVAQEQENRRLGWRIVPRLSAFDAEGAVLTASLTDGTGASIPDARVRVAALFIGRASQVFELDLERVGAAYAGRLPVRHRGAWELRFTVNRPGRAGNVGPLRFTSTQRVDARPAQAPSP